MLMFLIGMASGIIVWLIIDFIWYTRRSAGTLMVVKQDETIDLLLELEKDIEKLEGQPSVIFQIKRSR